MLVLLTACGGGSGSSTIGGPETMSRFVAEADATCMETQRELKPMIDAVAAGFEQAASPGETSKVAEEAREVTDQERAGLDRLRDLPRPAGTRGAIATMLSVAYAQIAGARALAGAAEAEDEAKIESLGEQVTRRAERYEELAVRLGLRYCGHPH